MNLFAALMSGQFSKGGEPPMEDKPAKNSAPRLVDKIPAGYKFFRKDEQGRDLYKLETETRSQTAKTTVSPAKKKAVVKGSGSSRTSGSKQPSVQRSVDIVYMQPQQQPQPPAESFAKSSYRGEPVRDSRGHTVGMIYYPSTMTGGKDSEGNINTAYAPAIFRSRDDFNEFTGIEFEIAPDKVQSLLGTTNTIQDLKIFEEYAKGALERKRAKPSPVSAAITNQKK